MSGSSGSQTMSSTPWGPTAGPLKAGIKDITQFYNSPQGDAAFKPFPKSTYTPMSEQTTGALSNIWNTAAGDTSGAQAQGALGGIMSGANGINTGSAFQNMMGGGPDALQQYGTGIASGANGIGTGGLSGMLGQGPNALQNYAGGIASGAQGITTGGDYANMFAGSSNPAFAAALEQQVGKTADDVNRMYSMSGRYGSGAHQGQLTEDLGDLRTRAMAQEFGNNFNRQMGALGAMTGVQGQNIANQLGAAGALSGEQMSGLGFNRGLFGDIAGIQGQNIANQLGAAGALSGEQQTNFSNDRGLLGDITNVQGQNIANQMGAIGMAPSIQQMGYVPGQMQAGVGQAYDTEAGERLQSQIDKYYANRQAPLNQMNWYMSALGGPGGQFGTQTNTVQQPFNPFGMMLGGGLLASQMMGGMGGGGLLSGLFG